MLRCPSHVMSMDSMSTVHSYPPTPSAAPIMITPSTPQSFSALLQEIPQSPIAAQKRAPRPQATKISQFLFAPPFTPHIPGPQSGDQTRTLSMFKNRHRLSQIIRTTPTPLLTFHDRTPVLATASVTGLLEIDRAEECILGVDTSFWIAVALAYWRATWLQSAVRLYLLYLYPAVHLLSSRCIVLI
ncbi:uncharacterized protein EDB91DRAFT_1343096 [Suillus paluster]|uniref:uncharacterized protein n=1 Tax=Suillus paluster TaxID=48578 RepID=UPI001B86032C|nr:uncharacterized protein EDB91DRAFT_1343096 [Suillus paluster]KAG1753705.1 hypothetical protein EDB91DRAFT_1343096 [Suillus paluster]